MGRKLNRESVWLLFICFTLGSFAFSERINSWGVILLGVFFLADRKLIQKIKKRHLEKKILVPVGFFLLYLIFYFFSDKTNTAEHALFSKFTFLLLPLIFYYENYFSKRNERVILYVFSIALSIGFLYELSISLYTNYFNSENPRLIVAFNRMEVSKAIMHPGYYSNYFMFGIIWHYFHGNKFRAAFIALFTFALILLLSRIVLIFYIIFIVYVAYQFVRQSAKPLVSIFYMLLTVLVGGFCLYQIPTIKSRVNETIFKINNTSKEVDISSATDSRRITYAEEIKLIYARPLLGYGLGNSTTTLRKHLYNEGYVKLSEGMNNHNQYFKIWMQLGVIGLVSLVFLLTFLLRYFKKEQLHVAFWFTIMVVIGLLTDDMLEIQAGIVFFVLIWSLYLTQKNAIENP